MSKEFIYSKLQGRLGHIFLNRPDSRNAINKEMWLALPNLMDELEKSGAEVFVIEGTGDAFAAGADINELRELNTAEEVQENWSAIANGLNHVANAALPTIAAVDGVCMGGGCLLAIACDLRYASKRSRFAVPITKLGIALDDVNLGRLSSLVGLAKAKEIIFRGNILTSAEALACGLTNEVFENYEFASRLNNIINEILMNSSSSIRDAKSSFKRIVKFEENEQNNESVLGSYMRSEFKSRIKMALKD